jgi:hypothetical protein
VTLGQSITLAEISTGALVFTPASYAKGTAYASFTFQVQDDGGTAIGGQDRDLTPNTIMLDVTSVNEGPLPNQDPDSTEAQANDSGLAALVPESLPSGQAVEAAQTSGQPTPLPRESQWRQGNNAGYSQGEMRSIRDIGVNLAYLEAIVANGLQDNPVLAESRLFSSASPHPELRPEAVDVIEIGEGSLLPPHQAGEPEFLREDDSYSFIIGATSAVPITISVGYALWLLSEENPPSFVGCC